MGSGYLIILLINFFLVTGSITRRLNYLQRRLDDVLTRLPQEINEISEEDDVAMPTTRLYDFKLEPPLSPLQDTRKIEDISPSSYGSRPYFSSLKPVPVGCMEDKVNDAWNAVPVDVEPRSDKSDESIEGVSPDLRLGEGDTCNNIKEKLRQCHESRFKKKNIKTMPNISPPNCLTRRDIFNFMRKYVDNN